MTNEEYLSLMKKQYDSLANFYIKNNILFLKTPSMTYQLPLSIPLNTIHPNVFNTNEINIINILYIYQLLYKPNLTEIEINAVNTYTNNYLNLEQKKMVGENISDEDIFSLSIPIFTSYNESLVNSPAAILIKQNFNKFNETIEKSNGGGKDKQLVRTLKLADMPDTEQFLEYQEFSDRLKNIQNAGFTTIFLIAFAVFSTLIVIVAMQ